MNVSREEFVNGLRKLQTERNRPYSREEATAALVRWKERLEKIGVHTKPIAPLKFHSNRNADGLCWHRRRPCVISIGEWFLRMPRHNADKVMIHELCHAIPRSDGHDKLFFEGLAKCNEAFGTKIGQFTPWFMVLEREKQLGFAYVLECPECGKKVHMHRKCAKIESLLRGETLVCPRCQAGHLEINEELSRKMQSKKESCA